MPLRSGVYVVPTHRWYIERTVWSIAGVVLLGATALAVWVDPRLVLFVIATGAVSIVVSLTGFCPVGNVLARLGFTPMLGRPGWKRGDVYLMQTDRWYLERRIYLAVGINVSMASVLSLVHSPWWLLFTGFVGGAMVWFAATGYCIMANGLYWLGAEPRLAPLPTPGITTERSTMQTMSTWTPGGERGSSLGGSSGFGRGPRFSPEHLPSPTRQPQKAQEAQEAQIAT